MFLKKIFKIQPNYSQSLKNMSYLPNSRLNGKVAVVTASTDGIGFAIASRLAREGAKVVLSSRKQKNVESAVSKLTSEGLTVTGIVCHVSNAEDRTKLFKEANTQFGGIDILISNAAVNPTVGHVLECEPDIWDKIFDVNVKSSYLLAREALPYLRKRGGGKIVFVSSIAGYSPSALLGAYSVSKTALLGLTKAAAVDLARENITVNCVAPGIIKTKFAQAITNSDDIVTVALANTPMKRLGVPDEIAGVVAFLVSNDASYITGETVVIAGGTTSRL